MSSVLSKLKPEIRTALLKVNEEKNDVYSRDINILTEEEFSSRVPYGTFVVLQVICSETLKMESEDYSFFHNMLTE